MTLDLDGNQETIVEMQNSPSGLGWTPDNKLLVVSMQDQRLFMLDNEELTEVLVDVLFRSVLLRITTN
ncbi:hypothetical protein LCGC14_1253410 [marine sediment metagenome]|uniref:Uncharacterized protein n=1 Tax=marine sediment metagenome TaxID=412755 RepID=A0A0F9LP12_9ZZZZ